MLQSNSLMRHFATSALVSALAFAAVSANAQQVDSAGEPEKQDAGALYVPYGNLSNAKPEDVERAKKLGESLASQLLDAYEKRQEDPTLAQQLGRVKKRADDIADAAMAADRDKVLEFLGIDPQSNTSLYYFVSWSMPLEMLRSYAIEAMWSGGTLVFKGVPPGKDFGTFLGEDFSKLTYGKGASASLSIDPRLFDAYEVTTVPSIVVTTYRADLQCIGVNPVSFKYRGQSLSYDTCPPLDSSKYSKISGAVTSNYALQTFIDDGREEAKPYLKALARGYATGQKPEKDQKAFAGKWEDVISPSERIAAQEAARVIQTAPQQSVPVVSTPQK